MTRKVNDLISLFRVLRVFRGFSRSESVRAGTSTEVAKLRGPAVQKTFDCCVGLEAI